MKAWGEVNLDCVGCVLDWPIHRVVERVEDELIVNRVDHGGNLGVLVSYQIVHQEAELAYGCYRSNCTQNMTNKNGHITNSLPHLLIKVMTMATDSGAAYNYHYELQLLTVAVWAFLPKMAPDIFLPILLVSYLEKNCGLTNSNHVL